MANLGWSCCQKIGRHIQTVKDSLPPQIYPQVWTGRLQVTIGLVRSWVPKTTRERGPRSVVRGRVPEFIYK